MSDTMQVPDSIRQQAEEAKRLADEYRAGKADAGAETPEALPETPPEGASDPAPAPEAPETPGASAAEDGGISGGENWEQKYRTLKGKYDQEIPQLLGRIRGLEQDAAELRDRLTAAPPPQTVEEKPAAAPKKIDPNAFEDFGPEVVTLAESVNTLTEVVDGLRAENARLKQEVDPIKDSVNRTASGAFLNELADLAPQYREQNTDPEFVMWLQQENPYDPDGRTRQECLTAAHARRDAARVARLFNDFAVISGRYGTQDDASATPPAAQTRPRNIQPAMTRPGNAPEGKRSWTPDAIDRFYRDVREGRYVGKEAEYQRIQGEIFARNRSGSPR